MTKKSNPSTEAAELRRRAEERLKAQKSEVGEQNSEAEAPRTLHELQVHQIELEMLNEELQAAQAEAEAAATKYTDLYNFAPAGYLTIDREGIIHDANLASAALLGIDRSQLITRHFNVYLSITDRPVFAAFLARVFECGSKEFCEVTLLKNGESTVEVRIDATVDASGKECRTILEDITDQKQAENNRLILNKLEATGILAGGIAHDFNNLLTIIYLNLELAHPSRAPGKKNAPYLETAKKTALTASRLTRQLSVFADGGDPVLKPIRLPELIRDSAQSALSGSTIQCTFSMPDELWPVEADAGQIGLVIRNLILNAREAMPQGGTISVETNNAISDSHKDPSLPPGRYVRISLTDQGGGIARELAPKIFDPYFSTKQRGVQKGMGLGLTICHTVIGKHNGSIDVESRPGGGTAFHIHLPASSKMPKEEPPAIPKALTQPIKILVMDDEKNLRELVGESLRNLGHEVLLATEGQETIELYIREKHRERPFDLLFLDLTVREGLGGLGTIQELLGMDPATKAVVMSGYADDPAVVDPGRYGFKASLRKPFSSDRLQEILAQVMKNNPAGIRHE